MQIHLKKHKLCHFSLICPPSNTHTHTITFWHFYHCKLMDKMGENESFPRKLVYTLTTNVSSHRETSQMICRANQWTSFYIRGALVVNGINIDSRTEGSKTIELYYACV